MDDAIKGVFSILKGGGEYAYTLPELKRWKGWRDVAERRRRLIDNFVAKEIGEGGGRRSTFPGGVDVDLDRKEYALRYENLQEGLRSLGGLEGPLQELEKGLQGGSRKMVYVETVYVSALFILSLTGLLLMFIGVYQMSF
ncbi:hypothetical protein GCM10027294_21340 [Marinactinospora endophytica]